MKSILLISLSVLIAAATWIGIIAFFYSFEPSIGGLVFVCMFSAVGFIFAYLVYLEAKKYFPKLQPKESSYSTVEQRLAWYKLALEILDSNPNGFNYYPYICIALMYNDDNFYDLIIRKQIPNWELLPELHAWRTEFNNGDQWFKSTEERINVLKTCIKQLS